MPFPKLCFPRQLPGQLWEQERNAVSLSASGARAAFWLSREGCPAHLSGLWTHVSWEDFTLYPYFIKLSFGILV